MSSQVSSGRVSRREFLRRVGAGLAASLLLPLSPRDLWTWRTPPSFTLADWTQAEFEAQLGHSFSVDSGSHGKLPLKLVKVSAGSAKIHVAPNRTVSATTGDCFLLNFVGPHDQALAQNTYPFEHERLGKFALFIVPGAADEAGQQYVAVINRVRV